MAHSITTSIRLSPTLRSQLEEASHTLHRGKNWIIAKALEEFLSNFVENALVSEAHRQSILASRAKNKEHESWEQNSDTDEWV